MLANLDNEVIFEKAFADKIVLEAFVKDILGLDIAVGHIETGKRFAPPIGHLDFELDIFAETVDKRTVIELHRAQYDHNFDRFMHFLQTHVSQQQQKASEYKIKQTVYLIVVLILPYRFNGITREAVKETIMIPEFSTRNLKRKNIPIYAHQMVTLNPNHPDLDTPQEMRDWLDLFYQSIHSPERLNINLNNAGIKRAVDLGDYTKLTPQQLTAAKNKEQSEVVLSIYRQEAKQDMAINAINMGFDNILISELTGLTLEEILYIRAENKG
jgi:hypothetical protein